MKVRLLKELNEGDYFVFEQDTHQKIPLIYQLYWKYDVTSDVISWNKTPLDACLVRNEEKVIKVTFEK